MHVRPKGIFTLSCVTSSFISVGETTSSTKSGWTFGLNLKLIISLFNTKWSSFKLFFFYISRMSNQRYDRWQTLDNSRLKLFELPENWHLQLDRIWLFPRLRTQAKSPPSLIPYQLGIMCSLLENLFYDEWEAQLEDERLRSLLSNQRAFP